MSTKSNASKHKKEVVSPAASSSSSSSSTLKKRGWDEIESLLDAKKQQKRKPEAQKKDKLDPSIRKRQHPERIADNVAALPNKAGGARSSIHDDKEFIDDGLGGKFNAEGYTGRVQDGVRIFKAHVLSKPGAGTTKDCPFDCTCCYI
jgi:hypothetical protein